MYGIINRAIRSFIIENHSEAVWTEIRESANVTDESFIAMRQCEDAVTYNLVDAICKKFDMDAQPALEAFGEYWVGFSGDLPIGKLLKFSGKDLVSRLSALDEMHGRVKMAMPALQPPAFEFIENEHGPHRLIYRSHRQGLEAMVAGLVRGMAKESGEAIAIEHVEKRADGAEADVFEIDLKQAA